MLSFMTMRQKPYANLKKKNGCENFTNGKLIEIDNLKMMKKPDWKLSDAEKQRKLRNVRNFMTKRNV